MEKFKFSADPQEEKPVQRTRQGHGKCEVFGCPRDGHIHTGQWNCRYHFGKSGSSLARITMTLRNHEKEFDWYEHVLNATVTDFGMGDIAGDAPAGLRVWKDETLKDYKTRMQIYFDDLLAPKSRIAEEVAL